MPSSCEVGQTIVTGRSGVPLDLHAFLRGMLCSVFSDRDISHGHLPIAWFISLCSTSYAIIGWCHWCVQFASHAPPCSLPSEFAKSKQFLISYALRQPWRNKHPYFSDTDVLFWTFWIWVGGFRASITESCMVTTLVQSGLLTRVLPESTINTPAAD